MTIASSTPKHPLEDLRITQPRLHVAGIFLIAIVFLVIGVGMIRNGSAFGWLIAVIFGPASAVFPVMIWRPNAVEFTQHQLIIHTAFHSHSYGWQNITDIRIWEHNYRGFTTNRFVTVDLALPSKTEAAVAGHTASGHATLPQVGVAANELLPIARRYWRHTRCSPSNADGAACPDDRR